MARRSECLEAIRNELRGAGIRAWKVEPTNGSHVKVTWFVNGKCRVVVTSISRADPRAHRNVRAQTRRILRQDALIDD